MDTAAALIGRTIFPMIVKNPAPSILALSIISSEIPLKAFLSRRTAAEHLISLGYKRCAMYCDYNILENRPRLRGFSSVFAEAGLPDVVAVSHNDSPSSVLSEIRNKKITGFFCTSGQLAYDLIKVLNGAGLRVPNDVSIVGYDDTDLAEITSPSLTSVAHPKTGLALTAANKLIKMINHQDTAGISELMPPKIAVRDSTAAPADHA